VCCSYSCRCLADKQQCILLKHVARRVLLTVLAVSMDLRSIQTWTVRFEIIVISSLLSSWAVEKVWVTTARVPWSFFVEALLALNIVIKCFKQLWLWNILTSYGIILYCHVDITQFTGGNCKSIYSGSVIVMIGIQLTVFNEMVKLLWLYGYWLKVTFRYSTPNLIQVHDFPIINYFSHILAMISWQ